MFEHIVEITAFIVPIIIFIILFVNFKKKHNRRPSEFEGKELIFAATEGVTAVFLILFLIISPQIIPKIALFRIQVGAMAVLWVWKAYVAIDRIIMNAKDTDATKFDK